MAEALSGQRLVPVLAARSHRDTIPVQGARSGDMRLVNEIRIDGSRRIELHSGDLTELPFDVDLLVVSAFSGGYEPVPGTLIEALERRLGVNVAGLQADCETRKPGLGFWVSRPIGSGRFGRVLGLEMRGTEMDLEELLGNIFVAVAFLEKSGVQIRSMALPLPGAGLQRYLAADVIPHLLKAAIQELRQAADLERIVVVEKNPERVEDLGRAFEEEASRRASAQAD